MAPARALALALALAAPLCAAGGAPVPDRAPSPEETALSSATAAYKKALDRYNGFVVLNGSVQNDEAVALHAAKEDARRAMVRAQKAAGQKLAVAPRDGPIAPAVDAPLAHSAPPASARVPAAGRGAFLAGGLVVGGALLGVGAWGRWKRRAVTLTCPGCKRKLKAPTRGVKARCPKCKKVFDA